MNIQYTAHNTEVTDALKTFTEKKLARLNTLSDQITHIHVTFTIVNLQQTAEASISIPGNTIHASSESHDLYAAIDLLIDKLARQLKKHKEKLTTHR